ncbi:General transcription factor II-I repeat domain-containing protein 2 [Thelohanellus kitauei]|uniref:General transcription factor II-I repeat domain-containing protein 2 n=1 Tax=Thelohanellus kitauei TaxID=669202 RepID=A0A0C2N035_THEKT|nr:General transcription factor II-I repeat domain-containing protein 2 [Thelohanellus kitauei]
MLDIADQVCPEQKKFKKSACRETVACRIEAIDEDLNLQPKRLVPSFQLFSMALYDSHDINDSTKRIDVNGIDETHNYREDMFQCMKYALHLIELTWQKMARITTDGSLFLRGNKVNVQKRLIDSVGAVDSNKEFILFICIIHTEVLYKGSAPKKRVMDPLLKIVNSIRARGLNHREFIRHLEDNGSDSRDVL